MKNILLKLICLMLCFSLVLASFTGCKKKVTDSAQTSSDPSDDSSSDDEWEEDDSDEELDLDDFYEEDDWEDWEDDFDEDFDEEDEDFDEEDEDFDEEDGDFDEEDEDFDEEEDEDYDEEEDEVTQLTVYNSTPLNDNFRGVQAIYQMTRNMPQKYNLTSPSDELWQYEREFFQTMGTDIVRSFYGPSLAWDPETSSFDWDSEGMTAFYNNCKEMAELGIEVGITPQWAFSGFLYDETTAHSVASNNYKHCMNLYFTGFTDVNDFDKTMQGHRAFIRDTVLAFRAHGVTNVKYLFAYTEVNNALTDDPVVEEHPEWDKLEKRQYDRLLPLYDKAITALDAGLKDSGLRENYKIVGPCDAGGHDSYSHMVKYCLENLTDKIDIIGSHFGGYSKAKELIYDEYYWNVMDGYETEVAQVREAGFEYWVDEFNASQDSGSTWGAGRNKLNDASPWRGIAIGAAVSGIMNSGAGATFIWQVFENFWPSMGTSPGLRSEPFEASEFFGGIQFGGYIPNYNESVMPYYGYYALSLITKFIDRGTTYSCEIGEGIYASCIKRLDGEWTVMVTNYNFAETPFKLVFEESLGGKTFNRYLYNSQTIYRTVGSQMLNADAVAKNVTTQINDTLPPGSVAVYTTVSK